MPFATRTTAFAVAAAIIAGCNAEDPLLAGQRSQRIDAHDTSDTASGHGPPSVTDITIEIADCDYLQIDTYQEAGSDRDANLCSRFSDVMNPPAACTGLTFDADFDADNFNLPGDVSVNVPGTGTNYCDWAELSLARHFTPFSDPVNSTADDAFQGGCLVDGHKPTGKADISNVGLAASTDGKYLYIGYERKVVNGNERGSLILTREQVEIGFDGSSCSEEQPLTDLVYDEAANMGAGESHAFRIDLNVESTGDLAFAEVQVFEYVGPDVFNQEMSEVLQSAHWVEITDADAVTKALNVAFVRNKVEFEDFEDGIDGGQLDTAQWVEVAITTEKVFGSGCGLDFNGQFATSAASGGGAPGEGDMDNPDALKDYSGPFHFVTGSLVAEVDLYESCTPGAFEYDVSASLGDTVIDFDTDPIDVDLVLDCDGTAYDQTITDPMLPSGTIDIGDPTGDVDCTVTAQLAGSGIFDQCDAMPSQNVTVYPPLTATGALTQSCDGTFDFDGTLNSSSDAGASFAWTFTINGTTGSAINQEDGMVTLPTATVTPATIAASLTVSDDTTRTTRTGTTTCTTPVTVAGITVYRPLQLTFTGGSDATCDDGESALNTILANATITGGSGSYDLDYTASGDAVMGTCADSTGNGGSDSCSFDLGTNFCADGTLSLKVSDNLTGTGCPDVMDDIRAVRESLLDVAPLMGGNGGDTGLTDTAAPTN